jgi:hypothetical protein
MKKQFRDFESAREFAQSLGLKNSKEWYEYCKSGNKPDDIPATPSGTYKNNFKGTRDWLGTGWRDFEDAREFVHKLKLKSESEWNEYCKLGNKPDDIPQGARTVYKNKYKSMGDWLGTGRIADQKKIFRSFEDSKKFAQSLKLKNVKEWETYNKSGNRPMDIHANPSVKYKNKDWVSWPDFLGTKNISNIKSSQNFLSFQDARKFVHTLEIKNQDDWTNYCNSGNRPENIPSNPIQVYKNKGWISFGDWSGTGRIADKNRVYRPFKEAREFVRKLNLKGQKGWNEYCKSGNKPDDIPFAPRSTYKNNGWISTGDWTGTGRVAPKNRVYRSFTEAREFVRKLNLKGTKEWREYCKSGNKPDDIPSNPNAIYKNDFKGWGDWLGTGTVATKDKVYRLFTEARDFVRKLGLKGTKEWYEYCKSGNKPDDIPSNPQNTYKKEWNGYGNWLGNEFRPFSEAREFVRKLNLKGTKEWKAYCTSGNKPDDIPSSPHYTYKKDFKGFGDWLGTGTVASYNKQFRPFSEAREFVRKLGLKNHKEWKAYCTSGNKPDDIPSLPWKVYKEWKKK